MKCRVTLQIAVGIALGALAGLALWHGLVRWLPWWAQGLLSGAIIVALLLWACCAIAGRADDAYDRACHSWRENAPRVLGQDAPVRKGGVGHNPPGTTPPPKPVSGIYDGRSGGVGR